METETPAAPGTQNPSHNLLSKEAPWGGGVASQTTSSCVQEGLTPKTVASEAGQGPLAVAST